MVELRIPWHPRLILRGRTFRLPVQGASDRFALDAPGFAEAGRRWSPRDQAHFCYLRAPERSGEHRIAVRQEDRQAEVVVEVRSLAEMRQAFVYNGVAWPRRWPLDRPFRSTKSVQTLQDLPAEPVADSAALQWWMSQDDAVVWRQLPPAELPRAHFVNVHQGCPSCGTEIYRFNGFYPWKRSHLPCDFRSTCPSCGACYPSNDLARGDYTGGSHPDDGYGYFDADGHLFLFAATYHRDQTRACWYGIDHLTRHLRRHGLDPAAGRRLGLLLLRQAVEEVYLAAAPQFRYGPTLGEETPWEWGQPDWGAEPDPVAALFRKGSVHYCIDVPYVIDVLALAYDTLWPFLREDRELVDRARALGLDLDGPAEAVQLVEEMLACLLQCSLDGGAASNLPRVSQGALTLLRCLDRPDARPVMEWLFDEGPDKMRVLTTNNFFPDGTPPESTGGYNSIHTDGLFSLEYHLRRLRRQQPGAYRESDFPSLMADPRAARVARAPHEIAAIGRTWFQFGDGGAGVQPGRLEAEVFHATLSADTLDRAAEFTGDPAVEELRAAVATRRHRRIGSTVLDGVGIAVLRTGEAPERAAAGIAYGDTLGHRHMDLLDVQLFAHDRMFLSDLGYPQSWATIENWEGHWATHNSVWGVVPGVYGGRLAGRGRLVRSLFTDGLQVVEIEAERWAWDAAARRWHRPGVRCRRLLALVETDGQGVALIDLARVSGGVEHWRICRGLEGSFVAEGLHQNRRPGTVADPDGGRGQTDRMRYPDHGALAYLDEVAALEPLPAWRGHWRFRREPDVYLDLHQLRVTAGTEVLTARAAAIMGTPEQSSYEYRAALWRRVPADAGQTTCVDLVFEPRVGPATLASAQGMAADQDAAGGVELVTGRGRHITVYWAPETPPGATVRFADGAELQGHLAAVVDGQVVAVGTHRLRWGGRSHAFDHAVQEGRIAGLDRAARTVEVEGLSEVQAGDRVSTNPRGRGHNYRVERAEALGPTRHRLTLDVSSVLGRGRVTEIDGERVELHYHLTTRTGNLHRTRLEREADGCWQEIREACNPDTHRTSVQLAEPLADLRPGDWVRAVDYVAGDVVSLERVCRG